MDFQRLAINVAFAQIRLTPELQAALQSQFEAVCQLTKPPAEVLVASADCPARVHRVTQQKTLFDMRAEYQ